MAGVMSTNDSLRPQFWVLRSQTNTMVPLIAADELPPTLNIRGVSRSLEAKDLTGMIMAGTAESRHRTYIVDVPNESSNNLAPPPPPSPPVTRVGLQASAFASPSYVSHVMVGPETSPQPPKAYGISEQMPTHIKSPVTGSHVSVTSFTTGSSFTVPLRLDCNPGLNPLPPWQDRTSVPAKVAPGVKEYCSFWLRCGECDYAQQGCLYKHEMPLDRRVLERLGHRDIPRWYREKHGLGSFLAAVGVSSGAKGAAMEKSWRHGKVAEVKEGGGRRRSEELATKRAEKSSVKRSELWKEDWEKQGGGKLTPKSSNEVAGSAASSASPNRTSPVKSRGPASRSPPNSSHGNAHYQSVLAQRTDDTCLAALEADQYAKDRAVEDLKRLKVFGAIEPKYAHEVVTSDTSSSDGSAASEWVEGDSVAQSAAITKDTELLKNLRESEDGKGE